MRLPLYLAAISCALIYPATAADPIITEFCASNQNLLEDEDGSNSDWVEIYNPDPNPVDLTNWYLTDNANNKVKWQFPATTIPGGGYLIVFASDKNRRTPGAELHTSFALSAGGEYLGLIKSDGVTVASEYAPSFPAQVGDITYGIPSNLENRSFIASNAPCHWIVPTSASNPASNWKDINYTPSGWTSSPMGVGYDKDTGGTNYLPSIGSSGNIYSATIAANNASCYVRIPFDVEAGTTVANLKLRAKYDDGIAVWLNGQPVTVSGAHLKRLAPTTLTWNSNATGNRLDSASATFEDFDISENLGSLVGGTNVLTIQVMNTTVDSTDQLLQVELSGDVVIPGPTPAPGYFATATPGARNPGPAGLVIPQQVTFSRASGTYVTSMSLTLGGSIAGQVIRYTLDGTIPTATSSQYTAPLTLTSSALVRARIFESSTGAPGFVASRHYERLGNDLASYGSTGAVFKSALPIVVLNNNNQGEPSNDNLYRDTRIQIFDRDATGYATLSANTAPTLSLASGTKLRGRSSASFPKKSYGIEIRNETGDGINASILGMPSGEDWALIGGWSYDRNSMRNAWIYEVSRRAGRYAPRTRLVEVFSNFNGGNLDYSSDYRGIYILCETARVGANRIDVAKLETPDIAQPAVSGGYVFKLDPPESDEFSWRTTRGLPLATDGCTMVIHRPKLDSLATQQSSYLVNYFQQFENAVFSEAAGGFTTRNYRNFIDSAAWADHNLFNMVAMNVDGLRLSAYFHKDRNEKIAAGPLWDFDRSANSTDGRDDNPQSWRGTGDATDYHAFAWWQPLFQDIEFRQTYVDRWQTLRRGPLSNAGITAVLDGFLAEYKPSDTDNPVSRDYRKWYGTPPSNFATTETNAMKSWLNLRTAWVDSQFTSPPTISQAPGIVNAGQTTTISVPSGTTVYYTTDGSDPRLEGGGFNPNATIYTGAVSINSSMRLVARAYRTGSYAVPSTNWSGPVEALYLVDEAYANASNLRVSAVNYNPLAPTTAESTAIPGVSASDFEWFEIKNVSAGKVNLDGISLPIDKPVSATTIGPFSLDAGARAVIAKNPAAFQLRYGTAAAARVAGTWNGYRSLDNSNAEIQILDRTGATIAAFTYSDSGDWPTRADGLGSALEYNGTSALRSDYENGLLWKSSKTVHGIPGVGSPLTTGPIVLNEIVASRTTDPNAIEIFNTGSQSVNLGGWYVSNRASVTNETDYRQYRFPNGTILQGGSYLVLNDGDFNPTPNSPADNDFTLDGARGGTIWLISGDPGTGKLLNFEGKEDYFPTLPGIPLGRSPNGTGSMVPLSSITLASANSARRIGSTQVTEIHYHPSGTTPEFIELTNTGGSAEPLARWTVRGDVDFDFPAAFSLAAGESVVVVAFDPVLVPASATAFRSQYGVAAGTRLVGPWSAGDTLSNTSGTVRLRRKVPAPDGDPGFLGLMIEDEVNFLSSAPWPTGAAGTGSSIRRIGIHRQPNDPTAWTVSAPTPGSGASGYFSWQLANFESAEGATATADADGDGIPNIVEYMLGSNPAAFNQLSLALEPNGGSPRWVLNYTLRLDRDDASLIAQQSDDLIEWIPASNDSEVSSDGTTQQRRAWLPLDGKGFLRLKAIASPEAP